MEGSTIVAGSRPPTPITPPVSEDSGFESCFSSVINEKQTGQQIYVAVENLSKSISNEKTIDCDKHEPDLEESILFNSTTSSVHSDSTKAALTDIDIDILRDDQIYRTTRPKRTVAEICFSGDYKSSRVQYVDREDDDEIGDTLGENGKKKKVKLARTSTGKAVSEVAKTAESACKWGKCCNSHTTSNDLYDHLVAVHLKPFTCEENHDLVAMCEWEGCQMAIERGDWQYRYKWMEQHVRSRHTKNVETHICVMVGCKARFTTKGKLEEHVRVEHMNGNKKKKAPAHDAEVTEDVFRWVDKMDPSHNEDDHKVQFSRYMSAKLNKTLKEVEGAAVRIVPKKRSGTGSARRKRYARPEWDIIMIKKRRDSKELENNTQIPSENQWKDKLMDQTLTEDDDFNIEDEYASVTIDDLFPGYNFDSKKSFNEEREKLESKTEEGIIQLE